MYVNSHTTCSSRSVTSRWQNLPTTSCAGRSPAQGGLVFELGLHDGVMFVFQVEQDGSELLILTQILKWQKERTSNSFQWGRVFLTFDDKYAKTVDPAAKHAKNLKQLVCHRHWTDTTSWKGDPAEPWPGRLKSVIKTHRLGSLPGRSWHSGWLRETPTALPHASETTTAAAAKSQKCFQNPYQFPASCFGVCTWPQHAAACSACHPSESRRSMRAPFSSSSSVAWT